MSRTRTAVLVTALAASALAVWLLPKRQSPPDSAIGTTLQSRKVVPPAEPSTGPLPADASKPGETSPTGASTPGPASPAGAAKPGPPGSRPASVPSPSPCAATAERALLLPAGPARLAALSAALEPWVLNEPAAVNAWAVDHPLAPAEWDLTASLLIRHTDTVHRPTQVAREWAESIRDEALRARALEQVAREWAGQDAVAARTYIASTPSLDTAQRAAVLRVLTPLPPET